MQPGKSSGETDWEGEQAGSTSVLSKAISRPMEAKPARRWLRKELMAGASPARTPSSRKKGERSTESGKADVVKLRGLEDDGVDGQCEECWS